MNGGGVTRPLYVAVEGPIGVGKTTLVRRLRDRLQSRLVLEVVEENPFLSLFYEDRERYAFQTQLFFLMSRFRQQQELMQPDLFKPGILSDYHLLKDRIFARLTLKDEELALYERVYQSLEGNILKPDVLVYLNARLDVLLERIKKRARSFEEDFDADYLTSLSDAYTHYFAHYDDSVPLLALDTSEINYVDDDEMFEAIYRQVIALADQSEIHGAIPTSDGPSVLLTT
jgi:deoxyguanosine kinase